MIGAHDDRVVAALRGAIDAATQAGAEDVEASYCGTETQFTRFASSRFTQVGQTWSDVLRVRALVGGRMGTQICASLVEEAVRAGAVDAVEAARLSPPLDVPLQFAAPGGSTEVVTPVALPDAVTAAQLPGQLNAAFRAHETAGVSFAGSVKAYRHVVAVATAAGLDRRFEHAFADAQLIGLAGAASGFAGWCGAPSGAIELDRLAQVAADKALRSRDPLALAPGSYDVVLAPEAIAELLEWMASASFSATSMLDGTSLLIGRQGQPLCDERITVTDATSPGELPFDAEGTTRRGVTFIDAGKGGVPVSDRVTALRLANGSEPTGHAPSVDDDGALGPAVKHLHLAPGDRSEAELIASVSRGLYVTRFHYVNGLLDTRRATMTGMTRDGTFLIEDGKLGRAVRNMRFTQPMLEAFCRIGAIGNQVKDVPSWWSSGGLISTPAVWIRDFQFTGESK